MQFVSLRAKTSGKLEQIIFKSAAGHEVMEDQAEAHQTFFSMMKLLQ